VRENGEREKGEEKERNRENKAETIENGEET